jgi:thiol-disulfide isomerase/thioredoxin
MSPRVAVVIGLLTGVLTAGLVLVALFTFGPGLLPAVGGEVAQASPTLPASAEPAPSSAAPSASADASAEPSDAPPSEPSASPRRTLPPRSPVPGQFHVGEPAPKLVLPLLGGDGKTIDLASLKGKPVWVNFMGTYCPPCRDEFPVMSGFQARYADTGLVVLAVDVREETEVVQSFIGATGATFAVALDANGAAQKAWGAVALPVHYWIDAQGIVRDGALGGIGPDQMAQSLALILPGVTVTP